MAQSSRRESVEKWGGNAVKSVVDPAQTLVNRPRFHRLGPSKTGGQSGFSLVEVTLAIGIVAYSMLVIVGVMPVGLQSMQQSAVQYGTAAIARQISSELQEMPFIASASNAGYAITALNDPANPKIDYYTRDGVKTTKTAKEMNTFPYFSATYSTNDPSIPGTTTIITYPSNLQVVKVTVAPLQGAEGSRQPPHVLSFLVAKQNSL